MSFLKKSPWVMHYDGSSCNGCDIEVLACLTPVYDIERFGIINTGNPKHADILLITGSVNEQNKIIIQNLYYQMPDPKVVVAIGICASSGGIFRECYNVLGGIGKIIPVDVYVPGCAARPEAIIDGVVKGLAVLEEKRNSLLNIRQGVGVEALVVEKAESEDAEAILQLQKSAFMSEAELCCDFNIAPLRQTLDELKEDFGKKTFLVAKLAGTPVGSVRAFSEGDTCYIQRLVVDPLRQNLGIGKKLMAEMEGRFKQCHTLEVHTTDKSRRNIYFYKKQGYSQVKTEKISDSVTRIFLQKKRTVKND